MKETPKGAVARATAVAEGFAAAMRRRQQDREPRVLLHRAPGDPWLLAPGERGHDELLAIATQLVDLIDDADDEDEVSS